MIELRTLGALGLSSAEGTPLASVLAQPRRTALLCYLALESPRGFQRRDTLYPLFWPEHSTEQARHALRQSLYFLRHELGPEAIVSRGDDAVAVAPDRWHCDAVELERAADEGRLEDALALYRGDLLEGFHITGAPEFERWLDRERSRLRGRAAELAWVLAEARERADDPAGAAKWGRYAAGLSPTNETELRRLVLLLDRLGDRAAALRACEAFAFSLEREYELELSEETRALAERIRTGDQPRPPRVSGAALGGDEPRFRTAMSSEVSLPDRAREMATPGATRRQGIAALALLVLVTTMGALATRSRPPSPPALDSDMVAVAPFDVVAPALRPWSEGLVDVLSRSVDGAGPLRTVAPTVALQQWSGRSDRESADSFGRRIGAGLVLFGAMDRSGADSVRIRVAVLEVGSERAPLEAEVRGDTVRMDRLVDSLAVAVLRELGRLRPVGAVRQSPLGASSLPALKAFLQGEQFYRRGLWDSAVPRYDHATALDSTFALAYRRMGLALGWGSAGTARYRPADEYIRRAAGLNRGLAPRDSLLLAADTLMTAVGEDWDESHHFANERRLLAVLAEMRRRYPGDPEVWYALGEARYHLLRPVPAADAEALDAFDRAIALDSGFAPAYFHTPDLVFAVDLGDDDRARRYLAAYLRHNPEEAGASALRLAARLLDPGLASLPETARLIDTAHATVLYRAGVEYLGRWPDSAETAVRLLRSLAFDKHDVAGAPSWLADPLIRRRMLASALTQRGHLREAYRLDPAFAGTLPGPWQDQYARLALLGAVPAESAAVAFHSALEADPLRPLALAPVLPWWLARRDTVRLVRFADRVLASHRPEQPLSNVVKEYAADAARAYAALARGDTAVALRAFTALPDSACRLGGVSCGAQKLIEARLLRAGGRDRQALALLDRWAGPEPLAVLERGRLAERLGDRQKAAKAYTFVVATWRHADTELRGYVNEAREGLRRVAASPAGPR
jgi:DNA-binding SARP family transcriptional activator